MQSRRSLEQLNHLSQTQRERLAFIDFKVYFCGELRRADLESRFGVAPAAATRDLTCYRKLAPQNLRYDASAKIYRLADRFAPLFPLSVDRALTWLRQGFGDGLALAVERAVPTDGADLLMPPPIDTLATVSRSICQSAALRIQYESLNSGLSTREIVPLAVVDNGLRWHVRAYDRKNSRFGDFVLNRIVSGESIKSPVLDGERLADDQQWNQQIDLQLAPHPGLSHRRAVEVDFGMVGGRLRVTTRAALAGYALHRWCVDCTGDHSLDPLRHHLWLQNAGVLEDVDSATLAPGFAANRRRDADL